MYNIIRVIYSSIILAVSVQIRSDNLLSKIKNIVNKCTIDGIYVKGFIDIENNIGEFYSDMNYLYFEVGKNLLIEFKVIKQYSKLKVSLVNEITYEYEIDEGMIYAKTSLGKIILADTLMINDIDIIKFYNIESADIEFIICDAVEFQLGTGQIIFIDPLFYDGIGIGEISQKEVWVNNNTKDYKVLEICK